MADIELSVSVPEDSIPSLSYRCGVPQVALAYCGGAIQPPHVPELGFVVPSGGQQAAAIEPGEAEHRLSLVGVDHIQGGAEGDLKCQLCEEMGGLDGRGGRRREEHLSEFHATTHEPVACGNRDLRKELKKCPRT